MTTDSTVPRPVAPPAPEKPVPAPGRSEKGSDEAHDEEDSPESLANRELDEQTRIARPPLGN